MYAGDAWEEKKAYLFGRVWKNHAKSSGHKNSVMGDTVGDKDIPGLAQDIVMKLTAILKFVFWRHCSRVQYSGLDQGQANCNSRGICDAGLEMWAVLSTIGVARVENCSSSLQHNAAR